MAHLLPVQHAYILKQTEGKTEHMKDAARETDKKVHAELNTLRARTCNAECFDCSAKKPGWAVLPHGVFVCIDCAQIHRSIGRHVSQTKAINTGTYLWFPHELAVMRAVGNGVAGHAFGAAAAAAKPSRDAAPEAKAAYARRKYEAYAYGAPTYHEALSAAAPTAAVPRRAPAAARALAGTAAATVVPMAAPTPQPQRPSAARATSAADGSWALIDLFDAPPAARAAAAAAPAIAAPAHTLDAPARAAGRNTAEVLRLFDPLPPLAQSPSKPVAAGDVHDAFFATFGL